MASFLAWSCSGFVTHTCLSQKTGTIARHKATFKDVCLKDNCLPRMTTTTDPKNTVYESFGDKLDRRSKIVWDCSLTSKWSKSYLGIAEGLVECTEIGKSHTF